MLALYGRSRDDVGGSPNSKLKDQAKSTRKPKTGRVKKVAASAASATSQLIVADNEFVAFLERAPLVVFVYEPKSLEIFEASAAAVAEFGYSLDEFRALPMSALAESRTVRNSSVICANAESFLMAVAAAGG